MSEDDDVSLEKEVEVEEVLEIGFGEVEFEEIKVGFDNEFEEEEREDFSDKDLVEFLNLGFDAKGFGSFDLEEALGEDDVLDDEKSFNGGDFYKMENNVEEIYDVGKAYDGSLRDDYNEGFVNIADINVSVESRNGRMEGRSMLEISGFEDEVAEKKREDKRRFWDY